MYKASRRSAYTTSIGCRLAAAKISFLTNFLACAIRVKVESTKRPLCVFEVRFGVARIKKLKGVEIDNDDEQH